MLNRLERGTTAQNNAWVRPQGTMTIDTDKHAVRLHDGVTPGGYECVGMQAYLPPPVPGPSTLIGGDTTAGFYGEVSSSEFINESDLSLALGLVSGTQVVAEPVWLKFALDSKTLYIPKQSLRDQLIWADLYNLGLVNGDGTTGYPSSSMTPVVQDAKVNVQGRDYIVRLLGGVGRNDLAGTYGTNQPVTNGSEWNRLIYNVHVSDPSVQAGADWANYTHADLGLGSHHHTRETTLADANGNRTTWLRGYSTDVTYVTHGSLVSGGRLWRPVLELVE